MCRFNFSLKTARKITFFFDSSVYTSSEKWRWEIFKKLFKISHNAVHYFLHRTAQTGSNQNTKRSKGPRYTAELEDEYTRVSSLRQRHLTGPQLAGSLNSTCKIPVWMSAVKRWLQDASLPGREQRKRMANKSKHVKMGKRNHTLNWEREKTSLIGLSSLLQQDNDSKHSSDFYKNYLGKKPSAGILSITEGAAHSPHLNPVELL